MESWQQPTGAWPEWVRTNRQKQTRTRLEGDAKNTALALHLLLRYGQPAEHTKAIKGAKSWLLQNREAGGGWKNVHHTSEGTDTLTTTIVLDALRRAGAPIDHPAIAQGEKALIKSQHATGYWMLDGSEDEFGTCLAVEYLRSRAERGELPNVYLMSAKTLIGKAEQLCLVGVTADAKLAVVAAYHGLEHLLYGLIFELKDDQATIFRSNGDTVGFREALSIFEKAIQRLGIIENTRGLPLKTQLQDLAARRDQIIHQAQSISLDGAEKLVRQVREFVRRFDKKILGFPLLD